MDATDKQGYLGNLSKKTSQEINELLARQEKILENVKFINKLPDKGVRIKSFIAKLKAELENRMDVDATADLFHQMALNAERANRERGICNTGDNEDEYDLTRDPLKEILNRAADEKTVVDKRINSPEKVLNSYERVIKKSEKKIPPKKFYPHKSVKTESIGDLSEELQGLKFSSAAINSQDTKKDIVTLDMPLPSESPPLPSHSKDEILKKESDSVKCDDGKSLTNAASSIQESQNIECTLMQNKISETVKNNLGQTSENPKLKYRYDDNLEMTVYGPSKKYDGAKLLSMEESIEILEIQRKKQEALQAKQAASRLAQKLGMKMVDFEPKFQEMRYRGQPVEDNSDQDSCDSNGEELDYPD